MSGNTALPIDPPDTVQPLPPRPNLEYERKRAKQLLRQLRLGEPHALARFMAREATRPGSSAPSVFRLADAQRTIAREYGFASWPRLVEYFEMLASHERRGHDRTYPTMDWHRQWADDIVRASEKRSAGYAHALATFVPRLHGRSNEEIVATTITIEEARLAAARGARFPSWEVLEQYCASVRPEEIDIASTPYRAAIQAMHRNDLPALGAILDAHPEFIDAPPPYITSDAFLLDMAISGDLDHADGQVSDVVTWLIERGADRQASLTRLMAQGRRMTTERMQQLLDYGADPSWMPANGYTILEHTLLLCWNPGPADLIRGRVAIPKAFWISAGLGDVDDTLAYLDRRGAPRPSARRRRPDFLAVGFHIPCRPGASDVEIVWEGFLAAGMNSRFDVMDALLRRGYPIDFKPLDLNLLHVGVGNGWLPLVEFLVSRGADVHLKGVRPSQSALEMAAERVTEAPEDPSARRIHELVSRAA